MQRVILILEFQKSFLQVMASGNSLVLEEWNQLSRKSERESIKA